MLTGSLLKKLYCCDVWHLFYKMTIIITTSKQVFSMRLSVVGWQRPCLILLYTSQRAYYSIFTIINGLSTSVLGLLLGYWIVQDFN